MIIISVTLQSTIFPEDTYRDSEEMFLIHGKYFDSNVVVENRRIDKMHSLDCIYELCKDKKSVLCLHCWPSKDIFIDWIKCKVKVLQQYFDSGPIDLVYGIPFKVTDVRFTKQSIIELEYSDHIIDLVKNVSFCNSIESIFNDHLRIR